MSRKKGKMKQRKLCWFLVLILIFSFYGCGSIVKYTSFDETAYQPTTKIEIFSNPGNIKIEYKEIGLITASDNGWDKSESELIGEIRKKALTIGADAVILQNQIQKDQGVIPVGNYYFNVTERIIRAVAIKYIK